MKVLVVLGIPPLVEGQAQGRTSIGLVRGLQAHGLDVRVIAARRPEAPPGEPPGDLPVTVVDVPPRPVGWRSRVELVRHPFGALAEGPFAERVVEASRSVDVVHLEEVSTAPLARHLARPPLVHLHYLVRRDRSLPPPWRKEALYYTEVVRAEGRAARSTPFLAASSPIVRLTLQRMAPRANVTLAPLSLDPTDYEQSSYDGPPVAGLIGSAAWPPTRSAIERLLGAVWPLVVARVPEATLRIAGRGLTELGLEERRGVELLGEVDRSVAFLNGLSLLLYPVRRGSGMKVKVMEALACGLPVVTTPDGAEGIAPHDGIIVESEDERLAGAAAELLADPLAARQRGAAARRFFIERLAPEPATRPLLEVYGRMLETGR